MSSNSQDLSPPKIDYDTPLVSRFGAYLEGVLLAHTVVAYFSLARAAGLPFEHALEVVGAHLPFGRTTLTRRLKDWTQLETFLKLSASGDFVGMISFDEEWAGRFRSFFQDVQSRGDGI
ncbi:MAG: hypothetical protein JJ896_09630 [Rhodothermales bacterium]|nr:hypothetical protein [Rhodothermales bacterium]MBO6779899.1 hypothetical protein [Rhodothermales bacterium]